MTEAADDRVHAAASLARARRVWVAAGLAGVTAGLGFAATAHTVSSGRAREAAAIADSARVAAAAIERLRFENDSLRRLLAVRRADSVAAAALTPPVRPTPAAPIRPRRRRARPAPPIVSPVNPPPAPSTAPPSTAP